MKIRTMIAALGGAAIMATSAHAQTMAHPGTANAATPGNGSQQQAPADEVPQRRRDSGYPNPGTSADSQTGGSAPTTHTVRAGRDAAPNPGTGPLQKSGESGN